jgi:hypothetical protein
MPSTGGTIVSSATLQADGKCLLSGVFDSPADAFLPGLARRHADGTEDAGFHKPFFSYPSPGMGFSPVAALQADGKIIISGAFAGMDGDIQPNLARLENDPAVTSLLTSGSSTIRWLRGGSTPEVRDVTFDVKPPGSPDWIPLGTAHRIPGGWELSGLSLPATGTLRAQAFAGGSVMESVSPILTPLQSWRLQYFNTASSAGDAADNADPDHDGLTNFTEFAFGLSPVDRASSVLPSFQHTGDAFTATFTVPEGREDILYSAGWSPSMLPGTWAVIPDTGTAPAHRFSLPANGERAFVHYELKMR